MPRTLRLYIIRPRETMIRGLIDMAASVVLHLEAEIFQIEVTISSLTDLFMWYYKHHIAVFLGTVVKAIRDQAKCLKILILGSQVAVDALVHLDHVTTICR